MRSSFFYFFLCLIFLVLPEFLNAQVSDGILNITSTDKNIVFLNGKWEFYWNKFYTLEEIHSINNKKFCFVPHNWIPCNEEKKGSGYATYYVKIQIPESWIDQYIGLYIPTIGTSYKLYINGRYLTSVGEISNNSLFQIPLYGNRFIYWKAEKNEQEIIIHVSNFYHKSGGLWYSIAFGLKEPLEKVFYKSIFYDIFLFGSLFMFSLFHLGLFVQKIIFPLQSYNNNENNIDKFLNLVKQNISILFFSLFCFLIAIRSLLVNNYILYNILPDFLNHWFILVRIEYWTHILGLAFFTMFLLYLYESPYNRYIIFITLLGTFYFFIETIVTGTVVFTSHLIYFQIFLVFVSIILILFIVYQTFQKKPGSKESLLGGILLLIIVVNDILYARGIIQTGYFTSFGLFLFILFQSFSISRIFEITFFNLKSIIENLKEKNLVLNQFLPENLLNLFGITSNNVFFKKQQKFSKKLVILIIEISSKHKEIFIDSNIIKKFINIIYNFNGILEKFTNERMIFLLPEDINIKEFFLFLKKEKEYLFSNFDFYFVFYYDFVDLEPVQTKDKISFSIFIKDTPINYLLNFSKELNCKILITEELVKKLQLINIVNEIRYIITIKYNKEYIPIWEIYILDEEENIKIKNETKLNYISCLREIKKENIRQAYHDLVSVYNKNKKDVVYLYYLNQLLYDKQLLNEFEEIAFLFSEDILIHFHYEIGNPLIDYHHRLLIQIINSIHHYLNNKNLFVDYISILKKIIFLLEMYATIHFHTEEYLMEVLQFIDLQSHKEEHQFFIDTIQYFKNQLQNEKATSEDTKESLNHILGSLSDYLSKWLVNHILYSDKQGYGRLLGDKEKKMFSIWIDKK